MAADPSADPAPDVSVPHGRAMWMVRGLLSAAIGSLESPLRDADVVLAYKALAVAGALAEGFPEPEGAALREAVDATRSLAVEAGHARGLQVLDLVAG